MDIKKHFFTESAVKCWDRQPREGLESPSLEVLEDVSMWHLQTWFSGGLVSAGLMVEPDDLLT